MTTQEIVKKDGKEIEMFSYSIMAFRDTKIDDKWKSKIESVNSVGSLSIHDMEITELFKLAKQLRKKPKRNELHNRIYYSLNIYIGKMDFTIFSQDEKEVS